MFENLNNANPASRQSVDDIFAETDQPNSGGAPSNGSEITTRRVGVAAASTVGSEFVTEPSPKGSGKGFKIAVIVMVVVIVGLLGFLAYSKFFKTEPIIDETPVVSNTTKKPVENTPATTTSEIKETPAFVDEVPTSTSEVPTTTVLTPTEVPTSSSATILVLDADKDSLTDDEELVLGTNLNLSDTDKDGLSDYEEVKIYKTNPLKADTDGDTYSDGEEVKNGYNPNGAGKMPGNTVK